MLPYSLNFWRPRGLPKSSQNLNVAKRLKKTKLKEHMLFNAIFWDFYQFWPPKTKPKSRFFHHFFGKRRFCEHRATVEAKLLFFTFRASEKRLKIDANIDLEKSIEQKFSKIDFPLQVGFPKPPKILENEPQKRCKTKLV